MLLTAVEPFRTGVASASGKTSSSKIGEPMWFWGAARLLLEVAAGALAGPAAVKAIVASIQFRHAILPDRLLLRRAVVALEHSAIADRV